MSNLFIVGMVITGLWVILCWRYALKRNTESHWFDGLLAVAATILLTITLTLEANDLAAFDMTEMVIVLAGIALLLPGVRVLLLAEKPFSSVGALSVTTGIVLIIVAFALPAFVPIAAQETTLTIPGAANQPVFQEQLVSSNTTVQEVVASNPITLPTVDAQLPDTIPTLSAPALTFVTPTPRPELATSCEATVTTRLNLRDAPSTAGGAVVAVVDADSSITLVAQDTSGEWWYLLEDEREGWLFGDYLNRENPCDDLPVRFWDEQEQSQ